VGNGRHLATSYLRHVFGVSRWERQESMMEMLSSQEKLSEKGHIVIFIKVQAESLMDIEITLSDLDVMDPVFLISK
jgi:hypothetical protein